AMLELPRSVVDAGYRDDAHRDQPIRRGRHVFFGEKFVVGADQFAIKIIFLRLPQNEGNLREQNLGIDSVLILLADTFFGRARAGAVFERRDLLRQIAVRYAHAARDADSVGLAAVDDDRVRAVRHLHALWRPVAPFAGDAAAPYVWIEVDVSVSGDDFVLTRHDVDLLTPQCRSKFLAPPSRAREGRESQVC